MLFRFKTLFSLLLISLAALQAGAQTSALELLKKELAEKGKFTEQEFASLEEGELVIKKLPVNDRREVAVCGVIKLTASHSAVLEAFRRSLQSQRRDSTKNYGRFGNPPRPSDIDASVFDRDDVMDLRECRVGNCKWNLSAAAINEINSQLNWDDPEIEEKAIAFLSVFLAGYVTDYLENGNSALLEYRDKINAVTLRSEYESMIDELFWLEEEAPEFLEYLRFYPDVELRGVQETVTWSKVKIALKPVIMINHNVDYPFKKPNGVSRFVAFSRQIYSNHYFDSSLTQTILLSVPSGIGPDRSYLLFVNRSRAGALGGRLGRFARAIVQNRARGKLEELLEDTKKFTGIIVANREIDRARQRGSVGQSIFDYIPTVVWVALALPVLGLLVWFILTMIRRRGLS